MPWTPETINDLRLVAESVGPRYGWDANQAPHQAVLQLVGSVGDLAMLCNRSTSLSKFESKELAGATARSLLALLRFADIVHVDIPSAVEAVAAFSPPQSGGTQGTVGLTSPGLRPQMTHNGQFTINPAGAAAAAINSPLRQPATPPSATPVAPLSPHSLSNFWAMLDHVEETSFTPQGFADLELTFCVPSGDGSGRFIDLIDNGRNVLVTTETKGEFIRLARRYDPRRQVSEQGNHFQQNKSRQYKRTLCVQLAKQSWDPHAVAAQFSPTHFNHGIFSPHTESTEFDVEYPRGVVNTTANSQDGSPPPQPLTPVRLNEFWTHLDELSSINTPGNTQYTEEEFAELGLRFVIPHNGGHIELMNGGASTPVTLNNLALFIRQAREKRAQLLAEEQEAAARSATAFAAATAAHNSSVQGARTPPNAAPPAKPTIKSIAICPYTTYDPQVVAEQFSPTHFKHGMFAPHCNATSFDVDYASPARTRILPPAAREVDEPFHIRSIDEYLDYIVENESEFPEYISTVEPSALRHVPVTFCLPVNGRIIDLIPDGRRTLVTPTRWSEFKELVHDELRKRTTWEA